MFDQMSGKPGEGHFGGDILLTTKTQYPFETISASQFWADKIIYISRNPIDIISSSASFAMSEGRSMKPVNPWNTYKPFWGKWVKWCSHNIARYYECMIEQSSITPTFCLRYEDLQIDPLPVLSDLYAFMLGVSSIQGTVLEMRLKEVCKTNYTANYEY